MNIVYYFMEVNSSIYFEGRGSTKKKFKASLLWCWRNCYVYCDLATKKIVYTDVTNSGNE